MSASPSRARADLRSARPWHSTRSAGICAPASNTVAPMVSTTRLRAVLLPLAFAGFLLLSWQALSALLHVPKVVLPAPSDILSALVDNFGLILRQAIPSLRETIVGFLIAAVAGVGIAA